jgi:hypothetical protein
VLKHFPGQLPQQPSLNVIKGVWNNSGVASENKALVQKSEAPLPAQNKEDPSIFGGKPEVSRIKLEHEMRKDSRVWQAARQSGLVLSPVERAKLVKEVFSQTYGRNISKTDLKWGVKSLNKKMIGTKSLGEHAKIRKEIKFLKKIGGIKG